MIKSKKITFAISSLSGGGAENICVNIANYFAKYRLEGRFSCIKFN